MSNKYFEEGPEPFTPTPIRYGRKESHPLLRAIVRGLILSAVVVSFVAWFASAFSLERKAFSGQAEAQYLMGKREFDRASSAADYARAARWIHRAAEQGYAKAQAGLGLMYENGLGVPRDYNQARKWLERAADQGLGIAQNELGVIYAKGRGVPQQLGQAAKWCQLAAAQGSEIAQHNLELIQAAGTKAPLPKVTTRALATYKNARVAKVEADGVTLEFRPTSGGIGLAKVQPKNLPENLRELCEYASGGNDETPSDSGYSQLDFVSAAL